MGDRVVNRIPTATYRLQFNSQFSFGDARRILTYLHDLGISDLYASPLFQAGPASTHGYDICAFNCLNPNLGSAGDLAQLAAEGRQREMGLLMDMVPNHMGNHSSNSWWTDVLKHGSSSRFASYFDIDWNPPNPSLQGKILLPELGDRYGTVLERGELRLDVTDDEELVIKYFDSSYPISPESTSYLATKLGIASDPVHPDSTLDRAALKEIAANVNGQPGVPQSWQLLDELLQRQHYRLAFWRVGGEELNYRRFFDVTSLVSVRVEDPAVFADTHKTVFDLIAAGTVTGLRIDHPDGLRDPRTYLQRLQQSYTASGRKGELYVVVEKILSGTERLPADWPVHGTTGYDFLNKLNGVFVQPKNASAFVRIYSEFANSKADFSDLAARSKREILERSLISETKSLTARLRSIARCSRYGRDFTQSELHQAVVELLAAFPIYRNYVRDDSTQLSPSELEYTRGAIDLAKSRAKPGDHAILEFVGNLLLLDVPSDFTEAAAAEAREFVVRFQQLSGPATAKGLEDTAFYRFNRFISLNEVGGEPERFGVTPREFHDFNRHIAQAWPHTLLATATHDTKRGEDVRARLNVISEIPAEWERCTRDWFELNLRHKTLVNGQPAPSANDEYLLYQILIGAWLDDTDRAAFTERIQQYMRKALKEAKCNTSWTDPDEAYESAVIRFVERVLGSDEFLASFVPFQSAVAHFGIYNSLAQTLLKLAAPGVPDIYQGSELWDFNLVDPDNRRPVDYDHRAILLEATASARLSTLLRNPGDGAVKLQMISRVLSFRRATPDLFAFGTYTPLAATGPNADHVVAFARQHGPDQLIAAVPRFVATICAFDPGCPFALPDAAVAVPPGKYENILTGAILACHESLSTEILFADFPGALLRSVG